MAHNPLEHVVDNDEGKWTFFDTVNWGTIQLPGIGEHHLTKYMVLEVIAAGLILWLYNKLAQQGKPGQPPQGPLMNALETILTFIPDEAAKPFIAHHTP